mmetsp:Transcript_49751/g.91092  ORF Transcript_49751/g.91092 Transcript_49751/m.91092 type:complete len:207 (+) Transcript_49751:488-1108(+)
MMSRRAQAEAWQGSSAVRASMQRTARTLLRQTPAATSWTVSWRLPRTQHQWKSETVECSSPAGLYGRVSIRPPISLRPSAHLHGIASRRQAQQQQRQSLPQWLRAQQHPCRIGILTRLHIGKPLQERMMVRMACQPTAGQSEAPHLMVEMAESSTPGPSEALHHTTAMAGPLILGTLKALLREHPIAEMARVLHPKSEIAGPLTPG